MTTMSATDTEKLRERNVRRSSSARSRRCSINWRAMNATMPRTPIASAIHIEGASAAERPLTTPPTRLRP